MLRFMPEALPGELLYGMLSRYSRHNALDGPGQVAADLFGNSHAVATFDLPNRLYRLSRRMDLRSLPPGHMVRRMTLLPYYVAFQPAAMGAKALEGMLSGGGNLHLMLGVNTFRVPRSDRLKFCPECLPGMLADHGEFYWRRDQQLPGVVVCQDHGCVLRYSAISLNRSNRHAYVAADEETCPGSAEPVARLEGASETDRLLALAIESAALVEVDPDGLGFEERGTRIRNTILNAGLMRFQAKVSMARIDDAMRDRYGSALDRLPGVLEEDGSWCNGWLGSICRRHRRAFHPLYHLLLSGMLRSLDVVGLPFGEGPWTCRNRLASHSGQPVVTDVVRTKDRHDDSVSGKFTCSCGYVWVQSWKGGKPGMPIMKEYGPLLEPELRRLVASGASQNAAAVHLKIDPITVGRLAARLGVPNSWPPFRPLRPRVAPTPSDAEVSGADSVPPACVKPSASNAGNATGPKKDWAAIDAALVLRITAAAAGLRAMVPPVRVTWAAVESDVSSRDWIRKRAAKLPRCALAMERECETLRHFQDRRIRHSIRAMAADGCGVPAPWQVAKTAGLTMDSLPRIEDFTRRFVDGEEDDVSV